MDLADLRAENRMLRTPRVPLVTRAPRQAAFTTTKVPRFDGTTSWEQYKQVFDAIVSLNGWDNDTAALQLFSHLESDGDFWGYGTDGSVTMGPWLGTLQDGSVRVRMGFGDRGLARRGRPVCLWVAAMRDCRVLGRRSPPLMLPEVRWTVLIGGAWTARLTSRPGKTRSAI